MAESSRKSTGLMSRLPGGDDLCHTSRVEPAIHEAIPVFAYAPQLEYVSQDAAHHPALFFHLQFAYSMRQRFKG
jgi:hypothetical protein